MVDSILIVDDEPYVLEALKRALADEPFVVFTASEGREGLRLLDVHEIKVVISDEKMPGMSGVEFLHLVKERHPEVIRIMLTGHASIETTIRAVNYGDVYRIFTKPWNDLELVYTIRSAVERFDLEADNRRLLKTVKRQADELRRMEERFPGITTLERDESGAIILPDLSGEDVSRVLAECTKQER